MIDGLAPLHNHPDRKIQRNAALISEGHCWICEERLNQDGWCVGCSRRYRILPGGFVEECMPIFKQWRGQAWSKCRSSVNVVRPVIILRSDGSWYQMSESGEDYFPTDECWIRGVWKPPSARVREGL